MVVQGQNGPRGGAEYNVYSTFQSHEPEFDYLKSLEIEEKINKIRWLPQSNAAHFLLSTNGSSGASCRPGRVDRADRADLISCFQTSALNSGRSRSVTRGPRATI